MHQLLTIWSRLRGSCPVCAAPVSRTHAQWSDGVHELYKCPTHGDIEYAPAGLSLPNLLEPTPSLVWEV